MTTELSSNTLASTAAGLTRMLVVVLLMPGIVAGALVAGALALCMLPVLLLSPGRRHGVWMAPLMPMRSQTAARRPAGG